MTTRRGQLLLLFRKLSDLLLLMSALGLTIVDINAPNHSPGFLIEFLSGRIKIGNALLGGLLLISWYMAFSAQGLYLSNRMRMCAEEMKGVLRAVLVAALALLLAAQIGKWPTINLWAVICFAFFGLLLIGGMRLGMRFILRLLRRRGHNLKSLLIVGGGLRGQRFAEQVAERHDLGYHLLGYVDSAPSFSHNKLAGAPWLGPIEDLPRIVANEVIDEVAVALPIKSCYEQIESTITLFEEQGITVHMLSDFFQVHLAKCRPADFQGLPLVSLHTAPPHGWHTEFKRILDLLIAGVALVVLLPLFGLVAILIKLDSRGPVFFIQKRMGYNKRPFSLIKFRTMVVDAEARMKDFEHLNEKEGPIFKIRNDPRLTRFGRWLRKTSIDELPQLINVVLGDMSLVGPRPLSMRDALGLEEAWQKRRFSVKPGITGLWQVSGRSNLSFEQWMQLDLEYIDRWSLILDCQILLRTVPAVITGNGAA